MIKLKKGFTLVELIIVMAMISIISAITFVSFSSYLEGVRDANRISQLNNIRDGIALKVNSGDFLKPEGAIEIQHNGETVAYQGYFGPSLIKEIEYNMQGVDPSTDRYFTYTISNNGKYFQLLAFLENESSLTDLGYTNAVVANNEGLIPYVVGNKEIGVFFDDNMIPIEEYETSPFNIETGDSDLLNVLLRNDRIVSESGDDLFEDMENVVTNYADNVYGCEAEPYSNATYVVGNPDRSNTSWQNSNSSNPCYFKCDIGFTWDGSKCGPVSSTRNVSCDGAPSSNFNWNSVSSITQTWDSIQKKYTPSSIAQYNINPSNSECRFTCEANYTYNSSSNECVPSTRNESCGSLPAGAKWWDGNTLSQTWNGTSWSPSFVTGYSANEELNACKYSCATNYEWDSSINQCVSGGRVESCGTLPSGARWWDGDTITQTWDGTSWIPSFTTAYSSTQDLNACKYTCDANYSWNGNSCVADNRTQSCGSLPAGAKWWDGSSINQTWNGSSWSPSFTLGYSAVSQSNACKYTCQSGYSWDGSSCAYTPSLDFKNTLVSMCGISDSDFDNKFDLNNGVYNGNINCSGVGLSDSDLDNFNQLREVRGYLNISSNSLTNLSGLSQVGKIFGDFDASSNNINNIGGISALWSAKNIDLSNNQLSNLNGLDVTDLVELNVSNNNLTDISSLTNKYSLEELDISNNNISNIGIFEWKSSLEEIDASANNISDLRVFNRGLDGLRELNLSNNSINDLTGLQNLNLEELFLHSNGGLNDISLLDNYTSINKTISLDNRVYSNKMGNLSSVCNTWNILDQNLNNYSNILNVCSQPAGSYTNFDGRSYGQWSVLEGSNIWEFDKNRTGSRYTGPQGPYDGSHYLYTEASWNYWQQARLLYTIDDNSNYLNFYYHMYGNNMGYLRVYAYNQHGNRLNNGNSLYNLDGPQQYSERDNWKKTPDIDLPENTKFIVLNFVVGLNYTSDFAIDAITVGEK